MKDLLALLGEKMVQIAILEGQLALVQEQLNQAPKAAQTSESQPKVVE